MLYGEQVAQVLGVLRMEKNTYTDYLPDAAIKAGEQLIRATDGLWEDVKEKIIKLVHKEIPLEYPYVSVWWYSVLMAMKKDGEIFSEFVEYVRTHRKAFSPNTQHFLFYQLKFLRFQFPELDSFAAKEGLWNLFLGALSSFEEKINASLAPIPEEKRNSELVLVITEQFIAIQHGPTKTALDRCRALISKMGKKVLLINTAEVLSRKGEIPFRNAQLGSIMPELAKEDRQEWKGVQIPYLQADTLMPDVETLNGFLLEIRNMAPSIVVSIGGSSILANLVNKMIPVLTVGLSPADLEYTGTKYQTLSRPLTELEEALLKKLGYGKNHVIESVFTSGLKTQTEHVDREGVGLPAKGFLMAVVGTRLDNEVTDDFLEMVQESLREGMYLVFIGTFNSFDSVLSRFPRLAAQTVNLGYCQDILSRIELCDLYLNPIRKGGGTSCVEALFKGVPVISVEYGDVSVNVGKDFCVRDYGEMSEKIGQYYEDSDFYREMAEKAKKRAEILLDTEGEFERIILEMQKREQEGQG